MKISYMQKLMEQIPKNVDISDPAWRNAYIRQMGVDPSDIYQELEMESRLVDTHMDVSYGNVHVSLHSHNFYELLLCESSCNVEYLVGAERYRLQKGDIVMIPPGVSHRPLLPETMAVPYRRCVLWISRELIDNLRTVVPELNSEGPVYNLMLRTADTPWAYLADLFENGIAESKNRASGWELALLGNTITLLACLRRAYQDRAHGKLQAEKPELLDRLLAYIEENLAQKITLSDAARHFFVSESTVTHLFRRKMGVSFYRCVTQRRLIAAKTLIEQGALLEDVALRTGFQDYSGFYRAFRQEYGISPRQYRQLRDNSRQT